MKNVIIPETMRETDGTAYADRVYLPLPPPEPTDLDMLKEVVVYLRNPESYGHFLPTIAEESRIALLSKLNRHIQRRILQGAK